MADNDTSVPWAGLLDIGAIICIALALLYTAGWSYAYHYFQCFHLGLLGLEIEREYIFLYGFWVCIDHWCLVPLCLLAAFGLPLLLQRYWQQRPELRPRLRANRSAPPLHRFLSAWRMDGPGCFCQSAAR